MSAKKKTDQTKVEVNNNSTSQNIPSPASNFFDNLGNRAPFIAFAIIFLVGFIIFKDYLLFQKAYYFNDMGSDSENYLYPILQNTTGYISKYGMPKWSFNFGMGQNIFPFFLRDPFDIFLYIAGKDNINYGTIYKEFAKILLGALVFYYYLKTLNLSDYTRCLGTMFYSFCGFIILGSGWQIFTFEAFNMALLLLGFEQLYSRQKWIVFVIAIFLICISQPVNLYIYGVLLISYTLLRHIQDNKFNVKDLSNIFLKMAGLGLISMLLGAPMMLEIIYQILESPRGSGVNSYANVLRTTPMFYVSEPLQMGTSVMRFFANDILGSGSDFKGWTNYLEAPLFYCGLPCLVLMPQVFQFLEKRIKIAFILFLAIWMMPIIFPYFRRAFWLFSGDYYRAYSFFVAFFFIYYSLFALDQIIKKQKINLIVLAVTIVVLLGLLHYPFFDDDIVVPTISVFVTIMLIVYGALLFFMSKPGSPVYLKYVFIIAVVFELCFLCGTTVNDRKAVTAEDITARNGYNDHTDDALKYIQSIDHSFYRIDKTYASSKAMHYSINDGLAQGYKGTSGYSPFNQQYYISYLQLMGIANKSSEIESRWALGLTSRPILESQNRVKYMLAKTQVNPIWSVICDQINTTGDVKIFRNKFVLPVGFTYDHYLKESVFEKLTMSQKDFTTLKTCVINDSDVSKVTGLKEFQLMDTFAQGSFSVPLYKQCTDALSKDTLVLSKFTETELAGNINASEDKMMYITIPYDAGWTLKVDGQKTNKIILDGGMTGVMLKKGAHAIEMTYELRFFKTGVYLCLVGLLLFAGLWFYLRMNAKKVVAQ